MKTFYISRLKCNLIIIYMLSFELGSILMKSVSFYNFLNLGVLFFLITSFSYIHLFSPLKIFGTGRMKCKRKK